MNYELAKQLQAEGFPIRYSKVNGVDENGVPNPTLSELIEACVKSLDRDYDQLRIEFWLPHNTWIAQADFKIREQGSTPEEAVAKLWLSLNKKD